jgi:hypothetical protein
MNRLSTAKRVAVISARVEGCSVRSTSRLTGVAKGTILRLLADVGTACARCQDTAIRKVTARRVQVDEIWSFVGGEGEERHARECGPWGGGRRLDLRGD